MLRITASRLRQTSPVNVRCRRLGCEANSPNNDYTDKLQFTGHEEGRIRALYTNTATPNTITGFAYDYMLKDHLGNVRMVLTDELVTDMYPAATMETATATTFRSNVFRKNSQQLSPNKPRAKPGTLRIIKGNLK